MREGHEVSVIVWKDRYEAAWEGLIPKLLTGKEKGKENLLALADLAKDGKMIVLVDSEKGREIFKEAKYLYGGGGDTSLSSPIAVGGWMGPNGILQGTAHLLFRDIGLWPGGMGSSIVAGATVAPLPPAFEELLGVLRLPVGLFSWDIVPKGGGGELEFGNLAHSGLPWMHAHAFVSELSDFGGALMGLEEPHLERPYTVAIATSQPPWPLLGANSPTPFPLTVSREDQREVFFHDVRLTDGKLTTAGVDGLVGVVRGAGRTLETARRTALERAGRLGFPERQFRADVGVGVAAALAGLDLSGYGWEKLPTGIPVELLGEPGEEIPQAVEETEAEAGYAGEFGEVDNSGLIAEGVVEDSLSEPIPMPSRSVSEELTEFPGGVSV
jgi:hypothetical protein